MIQRCTPWHEAGHAVVGELTGINILAVHVYQDGEIAGAVDRGTVRADAWPEAFGLMMMAGFGAELLFWGDPEKAWEHADGDREGLGMFGHREPEMLGWGHMAAEILRGHQAEWEALARMLEDAGTLTGDEIRSVLA